MATLAVTVGLCIVIKRHITNGVFASYIQASKHTVNQLSLDGGSREADLHSVYQSAYSPSLHGLCPHGPLPAVSSKPTLYVLGLVKLYAAYSTLYAVHSTTLRGLVLQNAGCMF